MDCRMITISKDLDLLESFKDDEHLDVTRWVLQAEVDEIDERNRLDVQRRAANFFIEDGKLKRFSKGYGPVHVVPEGEGETIARGVHESSGHLGRDLMMTRLVQTHYWTSMRKDVDTVISTCARCVQFGTRLQKLLLKPIIRYSPFDMLALDYLHMPKGSNGKDIVLVVIDCFSRYIMAWAFKGNPTSSTVVKCLTEIESRFVVPRELLMDNFFDNREIHAWAAARNVQLTFSAPYAHVGLVENANHLVLERLRRLANTDVHHVPLLEKAVVPKKWPEELEKSVKSLNERKMAILGGYSPKDLLFGIRQGQAEGTERVAPGVRVLMIESIRSEATEAFVREQARRLSKSKEWNSYEPKPKDLVMIYDASGDRSFETGWKLRARWQGPYVVECVRRRSARVKTLDGRAKAGWVAWALMKRWPNVGKRVGPDDGERGGEEGGDGGGRDRTDGEEDGSDEEEGSDGRRRTRSGRSGNTTNDNDITS
ncbi:hypothetical protein FFLO_03914 [Filobasidium floriforme]|uniref:Integrase catalytic domain-containing protein n=1 Tax=Filobasidium floriforme TaxID=5210 RepID=A0A8K0NSQ5_9TREE|nr:hypothetical protein FFLO_03914 [Filobasidium floriforme]